MNDSGTIVGYYSDSSFTQYGFIYQSGIGYTELAGPDGSASDSLVEATSINASGEVVGDYYDSSNNEWGFIYQPGQNGQPGAYTALQGGDSVNAQYVFGLSVNGSGEVAGNYGDNNTGNQYGFTYVNGTYTALTGPDSNDTGVEVSAINASGEVVGYYTDDQFTQYGYTYQTHTGQYTTVAGPSGATNLQINAVNDSGELVGYYYDASGAQVGFDDKNGVFTTLTGPNGAEDVDPTSINDSGEIVASYWDATTQTEESFETSVACFRAGTRIGSARGEIAIEDLQVGDLVRTASGDLRPIRWLGHRSVDATRHPAPRDVWPVRIAAHAFGEGLPRRDLWVSPGHNLACEGALMPACVLANGISVAQVETDQVEYWHVEFDSHDILLAEGLPAESYLDCGNRDHFINGGACVKAFPDFKPVHWSETCLPLVKAGPQVERIKARLLALLLENGFELTEKAGVHVLADGRWIAPTRLSGQRFTFDLPEAAKTILLCSKSFVPAHVAPASFDTREIGICVARLQIDGEEIALDRDDLLSSGWCEYEGEGAARRWTRGAARLPSGARVVVIDRCGSGLYWRAKDPVVALFG